LQSALVIASIMRPRWPPEVRDPAKESGSPPFAFTKDFIFGNFRERALKRALSGDGIVVAPTDHVAQAATNQWSDSALGGIS
jgi:hypothetical protein